MTNNFLNYINENRYRYLEPNLRYIKNSFKQNNNEYNINSILITNKTVNLINNNKTENNNI